MASYLCVRWLHSYPDEPVLLCSELDDARWELRKIEIYADGRKTFADALSSSGNTQLSIEPIPSEEEIAADSEFEVVPYTEAEFEIAWTDVTQPREAGK